MPDAAGRRSRPAAGAPSPGSTDTDDELFYEPPRLVLHIDDSAVAALTELYRAILPAGGRATI